MRVSKGIFTYGRRQMATEFPLRLIDSDIHAFIRSHEMSFYRILLGLEEATLAGAQQEILHTLLTRYGIEDTHSDPSDQSKRVYLTQTVDKQVKQMVSVCEERVERKQRVVPTVEALKTLVLPEQRSAEWFAMRKGVLTASSLADALGKGHFNTRESLLIDKTSTVPKPFFSSPIMEWGVRYEEIATRYYEFLNMVSIVEFGLVPHPDFPIFGASPDGICDTDSPGPYVGRMLEIKCPPKRQFTKEVPEHYWMQVQGQLETCGLEECDFFQVKLDEHLDINEYADDVCRDDKGRILVGYSSTGHPKGLLLTFESRDDLEHPVFTYRYPPLFLSLEDLLVWKEDTIATYTEPYQRHVDTWWCIERYECTLVLRDVAWWRETMPQIINFWDEVLHYRKVGNHSLLEKKEARKQKRKISVKASGRKKSSPKHVIQVNKDVVDAIPSTYLLDSDED
jgi:putative phage-type endonuclease